MSTTQEVAASIYSTGVPARRLKFALTISAPANGLAEDDIVAFVPMEAVGDRGELDLSQSRRHEEVATGYTRFANGDVLVAKITPCFENGKGALVRGLESKVGFGTTELHVLTPGELLDGQFLYYVTMSSSFRSLGEAQMTGAAGQKRVPTDFVRDYPFWIPPLETQQRITDYLDRETAEIDGLIAEKERMLALLEEKRAALVTHAVTRGLDPDVPLKPSGLECFGSIPNHWQLMRLKHFAQVSYGVGDELDRSLTSGIPLISLPNVGKDGSLDLAEHGWAELDDQTKDRMLLRRGDLLFNWRNGSAEHLGKTAYFDSDDEFTHVGFLLRIRFDQASHCPRYFQYVLNALRSTGYFLFSRAMVNNTFNQTELENLTLVVPPIEEQKAISGNLHRHLTLNDTSRLAIQDSVALLRERRSALITAAVTGQIPVEEMSG